MPFDHVITLAYESPGERNAEGIYVPGEITTARFWVEVEDGGTEDQLDDGGGTLTINLQTLRLRWNTAIALSSPTQITVTDSYGRVLTVLAVRADDERRRFIELDVSGVVG